MRRAAKVDANQAEIVKALRKAGASVLSLAPVGQGVPDLLVGALNQQTGQRDLWLLECKDGAKVPSARKLTPDQEAWISMWRGKPVSVVNNPDEALAAIGREA